MIEGHKRYCPNCARSDEGFNHATQQCVCGWRLHCFTKGDPVVALVDIMVEGGSEIKAGTKGIFLGVMPSGILKVRWNVRGWFKPIGWPVEKEIALQKGKGDQMSMEQEFEYLVVDVAGGLEEMTLNRAAEEGWGLKDSIREGGTTTKLIMERQYDPYASQRPEQLPADPAFAHDFAGDSADCSLCGERRLHHNHNRQGSKED